MTEAITTRETPSIFCLKNNDLSAHLTQMLQEPEIHQENFLPRKKWEEELSQELLKQGATVIFLDVVGGGQSAKQGNLPHRIQAIADTIEEISNPKNGGGIEAVTTGRRIFAQKRQPGSDEFLFFIEGILKKGEVQKKISQLKKRLREKTGRENDIYVGVCSAAPNNQIGQALKSADIALTAAKELAKNEKVFSPQITVLNSLGQASLNESLISPNQLEINELPLAEGIKTQDTIAQIREEIENGQQITIISPQQMRKINKKYGMREGNKTLTETSEAITGKLEEQGIKANIYKVGTYFVVATSQKIKPQTIEEITALTQAALDKPLSFYGLGYAYFPE